MKLARICVIALGVLVLIGCAAGPGSDWEKEGTEAGFWAGLWHGVILVVALIVSFFTDNVTIYETLNTGVGYDIGFVLGVLMVNGGGIHVHAGRKKKKGTWKDVGEKVERKIRMKFEAWADEDSTCDEGAKSDEAKAFERKIKAKIRKWLEED